MPDSARRTRGDQPGSLLGAVFQHALRFGQSGGYHVVESNEQNSDDDKQGLDIKRVDIPEDAYGAAILAFVKDAPLLTKPESPEHFEYAMWNCVFAVLLLLVNLFLQCSILAYVFHYVVALDIAIVQTLYTHFRLHVFDSEGAFLGAKWENYSARSDLCQIAMWNRPFYYAVLFCWSLVMMIEIRKSEELGRHILVIPTCKKASEMMIEEGGHFYVVAFTRWTRIMLICTVAVPKMCISLILLWLGCEWLSATIKFESLVMNTVAMAFIVNIDEILFDAVLPPLRKDEVQNIDFLIRKPSKDQRGLFNKRRRAYTKALFSMIILLLSILVYAEYMQDVLPPDMTTLRNLCQDYLQRQSQPICNGWTWYLRGNPSAKNCFPFPAPTATTLVPDRFGLPT